MDLLKLFRMQRALDEYIETEHGLQEADLFDKKVLALLVEIGELANETRCFKFWSLKQPSERKVILEEFVDGVHFILSLGLTCSLEQEAVITEAEAASSVTEQFLRVYKAVHVFKQEKSTDTYQQLLQNYFLLGRLLGFSAEEVEEAYVAKNEVNYERQQQGY
ncbi:dUTP diphosphatase [Pseudobacillus wudalianchiensis]|uniref:dUTPase n=1 Tax=Pseudobacillus wudalianchiensis TaxID=1743143 RepID=A0A1B9B882_9BACI|nr:dUTP diphosphatase [Bacillus wudalianchiensis]OCA92300.1 dUTPase [Bacillus wudalianchiensis]